MLSESGTGISYTQDLRSIPRTRVSNFKQTHNDQRASYIPFIFIFFVCVCLSCTPHPTAQRAAAEVPVTETDEEKR